MAKLKIDLDVLNETIRTYESSIEDFRRVEKNIISALVDLKNSGWDSNAGKTWFSLLDNEWLKNINFQIRTLESLKRDLETAKSEYEKVVERQRSLANYL